MANEPTQDHSALAQRVKDGLQKAQGHASSLRKNNGRLLVAGIVSSAATTLVAGFTAAQGPVVGGDGVAGWRLACIVAAVFGFVSTVCTGLSQQMKFSDRLSQGNQCVGRLRSLDVAITTGSRGWDEIAREYEDIAKTYPDLI